MHRQDPLHGDHVPGKRAEQGGPRAGHVGKALRHAHLCVVGRCVASNIILPVLALHNDFLSSFEGFLLSLAREVSTYFKAADFHILKAENAFPDF